MVVFSELPVDVAADGLGIAMEEEKLLAAEDREAVAEVVEREALGGLNAAARARVPTLLL